MTRVSRIAREERTAKLPLLGKIKVGKKNDEKGYPMSLDYFRADGKYASQFHQVFGDQPKKIEILFINDDPSEVCYERYECRDTAGKLAGYGDGKNTWLYNEAKKDYLPEADKEKIKAAGKWSPVLTIRFIIPRMNKVFGLWELSTKGEKTSIPAIRDTFDQVREVAGTVINIPFDLNVEKVKTQKPGVASLFPVISLVPNVGSENLEVLANYIKAGNNVKALGKISNEKILQLKPADEPSTKLIG